MGVTPPTLQNFTAATGGAIPQVSSPTEGIVIVEVEAKHPVSESTGRPLPSEDLPKQIEADVLTASDDEGVLTIPSEDGRKRKKQR